MPEHEATSRESLRRPDVDLLRAALVLGLVFFHTANIFDLLPYAVKNEQKSIFLMLLVGFFSQWGMPLLFLMAGISTWHSLSRRSGSEFIFERIRRLLVPFIIGMLVIVPPQRYYGLLSNPDFRESFRQFYPRFFHVALTPDFPLFIGADPSVGYFEISHLWFLFYLLVFSLIALPFFLFLKTRRGELFSRRLARLFEGPRVLFLAAPIVIVELFLRFGGSGGWNRLTFLVFLVCGYLFASNLEFERSARSNWPIALFLGSVSIILFFWISVITWHSGIDPSNGYGPLSVFWRVLKGCTSWFWVVSIWGIGQSYTHRRSEKAHSFETQRRTSKSDSARASWHKVLAYANEAVLPFYVIHQTVIVIIGYYVVKWHTGVAVKFLTISFASAVMTFLLYDVLVRRTNFTRVLFGMKPKQREAAIGVPRVEVIS